MADILKLQINVPEVIALQFSDGKLFPSKLPNAAPQLMFTLTDGRITFLPESVGQQLRQAGIGARVPFEICKKQINNGKWNHIEYEINTPNAAGRVSEARPTALVQSVQHTVPQGYTNGNVHRDQAVEVSYTMPAQARQLTPRAKRMMACMLDAVDVVIETECYLENKGVDMQANFESIRALAISFYIQESKDGAR